jgi:malonyl-CoA O-methyltransferase
MVEKRRVQRSFGLAALQYDGLASLQRRVADRLLTMVTSSGADCRKWLDVGAGTGYGTARLGRIFPSAEPMALDLAEGMLRELHGKCDFSPRIGLIVGDAEALPIADRSVDLIYSSSALHWCPDPERAFAEFARVLAPGGCLYLSTFGPLTLAELRESWARVDAYSHVNSFPSLSRLTHWLTTSGFVISSVGSDTSVVSYSDVRSLMRELKGLGASNATLGRPRGLVGKSAMGNMIKAYIEGHSVASGGIAASFEVFYISAQAGPR